MIVSENMDKAIQLARSGRFPEAESLCRQVLGENPGEDRAFHLLGLINSIAGRLDEAEELIKKAIAINGNAPKYFSNLGNVYKAQNRIRECIQAYQKAIELDQDCADAYFNLGVVHAECGEMEAAIEAYSRAIDLDPASFEANNNLGLVLMALGRFAEALKAFQRACGLNESVSGVWHNLGLARKATGDEAAALEAFCRAVEIHAGYAPPLLEAAAIYARNGESSLAVEFYERVLELESDNLRALEGLALIYESSSQLGQLQLLLARGLGLSPDSLVFNLVQAKMLRRSGKEEEALEVLIGMDLSRGSDDVVAAVQHEKGMLYDRLGQPDQAFACFGAGKRLQAAMAEKLGVDKTSYLEKIDALHKEFGGVDISRWKSLDLAPLKNPLAFIVGFPRSGTTLLDQVLDSHPQVGTIEEQSLLATLIDDLEEHPMGLIGALEQITVAQANELRERYFELARKHVELVPGQLLVDKFPLNIVRVLVIHRLFPEAKIILAIRHPCDVCLSCYMHLFGINNAMANFFSLEDAVRLYGKVMDLWRLYADRLPLNSHRIRYEDVVSDFQGEIAALLEFLGLPWDERVNAFHEHAKARGKINTPSYHQVTEPIYQRAAYRWKRYAAFFEPYMGEMTPYLAMFDYEPT